MDMNAIYRAFRTFLLTNSGGKPVYHESEVPTQLGARRNTGFITYGAAFDYFQQCSEYYTGTTEGDLDIVGYSDSHSVRYALQESILDLFMPKVSGRRTPITPRQLTNGVYLHTVFLEDQDDVFLKKTGQERTETPGVLAVFRFKVTV